jgi:hypothetical protein
MQETGSRIHSFIKRYRSRLQALALVAIIVLPFLLYVTAQAHLETVVGVLIGLMALVMMAVIVIS